MRIESLDDCFGERMLRKIRPDAEKSRVSLAVAEAKLSRAEEAFRFGMFDLSLIASYTAMFHAARAVLYRDGIQEKSHLCAIMYLRANYSGSIGAGPINSLDAHRIERHDAIYGLGTAVTKDDAETSIADARELLDAVGKIMAERRPT